MKSIRERRELFNYMRYFIGRDEPEISQYHTENIKDMNNIKKLPSIKKRKGYEKFFGMTNLLLKKITQLYLNRNYFKVYKR